MDLMAFKDYNLQDGKTLKILDTITELNLIIVPITNCPDDDFLERGNLRPHVLTLSTILLFVPLLRLTENFQLCSIEWSQLQRKENQL